jgi:hypothetical protein
MFNESSYSAEDIKQAALALPAEVLSLLDTVSKPAYRAAILEKNVNPSIAGVLCETAGNEWFKAILAYMNMNAKPSKVLLEEKAVFFLGIAEAEYYRNINSQTNIKLDISVYENALILQSKLLAVYGWLGKNQSIFDVQDSMHTIASILRKHFGNATATTTLLTIANDCENSGYPFIASGTLYIKATEYLQLTIESLSTEIPALAKQYHTTYPAPPPSIALADKYQALLNELWTDIRNLKTASERYDFYIETTPEVEAEKLELTKFIKKYETMVGDRIEAMAQFEMELHERGIVRKNIADAGSSTSSKPTLRKRKPKF